jgi:tRNA-Thr(GGU) m(6)t(6)A37 methyltransferase TsaA
MAAAEWFTVPMAPPLEPVVLFPIGAVVGGRAEPVDDDWSGVRADIVIDERFGDDALQGLDAFSHVDVVFVFHRVDEDEITTGARHPRGNSAWPRVGIFAQRAKSRPNRLGVSTCSLLGIDGRIVHVAGLDAIDGSPVLDLKPHMTAFEPREPVREPTWATEIMREYW